MAYKLTKLAILVLGLVIIFETAVLISPKIKTLTATLYKPSPLGKYAEEIVLKCKNDKYRPSCYEKEVPKLMSKITMEEAFEVTRIIQDKDQAYTYCHVLGHELSAREVQKDPSKWKDIVVRCPSGMCSNGCLHGGFQEKFRAEYFTDEEVEEIKPELRDLCEARGGWKPTGLEQASCYHALGHLTMYITNADIGKSVSVCDEVALKEDRRDFRQLCYDGAFMQIFQPLEPEDFALIKGKEVSKNELEPFCGKFDGLRKDSCWTESWPLFREELTKSPEGLVDHCGKASEKARVRCYSALIYVLTAQFGLDADKIGNYCAVLPPAWQGICFANAASRMIETDYRHITKALDLCLFAANYNKSEDCFKELLKYSTYNYHAGSEAFYKLCGSLPEPWKQKCLEKVKK